MIPPCILCRAASHAPFHEEEGHSYLRCDGCGFVFLHPRPSAEELHRLYDEETGATFHHGAEIAAAYEKRLEAARRLRIVAPALRRAPVRSALEIGCGAGYLLDHLRRSGWRVAGTERSDAYLGFARDRLGLEVGRERPAKPSGAVLLFNVLSHLDDPARDLGDCLEALVPGGVLVLETGNAAEVPPSRVGPFGAPEHIWHFTEPTLRGLLERVGFREIRVRRRNVEWQRAALRRLGGLRRKSVPRSAGAAPARRPTDGLKRRLAAQVLLGLRFDLGRLFADRRHFCTMFVTARRPAVR